MTTKTHWGGICLLTLLYIGFVGYAVYDFLDCRMWGDLRPWFGEDVKTVRTFKTEYCDLRLIRADKAAVQRIAERLHAEPVPASDTEEGSDRRRVCDGHRPEAFYHAKDRIILELPSGEAYDDLGCPLLVQLSDGYALLDCDDYADTTERLRLRGDRNLRRHEPLFAYLAMPFLFFGPTLVIDFLLLSLMAPGRRRRLLWYLLPLVHAVALLLFLGRGTFSDMLLPYAVFYSGAWCLFSLAQSLVLDIIVSLISLFSQRKS